MPRPSDVGVGVAALILNENNEILLLKRKGAHADGCWAVPGGWLERRDANIKKCVERECLEEVALKIDGGELFTVTTEDHKDLQCRTVTLYYLTHVSLKDPPIIMEPDKASELDWFSVKAPPSPLFPGLEVVLHAVQLDIIFREHSLYME
jgi:8-oxo-dGTP diphosphatase